jgi:hypothetical protein
MRAPQLVMSDKDRALLQFGKTMAAWANLEKAFYGWFEHLTSLDTRQAQPLYFTPTSFKARIDLLRAAMTAFYLKDNEKIFIEKALGLAVHYSGFRNKLAHGEFTFEGVIIESRHADRKAARERGIAQEQLKNAANVFQELTNILWKARDIAIGMEIEDEPDASLETCAQQVDELPRFESPKKNSPTPVKPRPQPRS